MQEAFFQRGIVGVLLFRNFRQSPEDGLEAGERKHQEIVNEEHGIRKSGDRVDFEIGSSDHRAK
jgi:hypothetical protein